MENLYQEKKPFLIHNWLNILLFILTVLSTAFTGMTMAVSSRPGLILELETNRIGLIDLLLNKEVLINGSMYALAIMSILLAHELGHYLACRKYRINCTLPYFIPFPSIAGTAGAFIKIRTPIPNRKALFDVGIAGPVAGFVVMIPWMIAGLKMSSIIKLDTAETWTSLQDPLITRVLISILGINVPEGFSIIAHPVYFAAWFGCLATSINLIPVGQLDGGHMIYAIFKRKAFIFYKIAFLLTFCIALLAVIYKGFLGWGLWLIIIFFLLRQGHPPTINDSIEPGKSRIVLAFIALLIFILTFMPVPIELL